MSISSKFVLVFSLLLGSVVLFGQQKIGWKKHVKLADELYQQAQYFDAAYHYESAWRQKSKKKELILKAAESYNIIRDYSNAARAYENAKDLSDIDPLVGLKYGRALKQAGLYEKASRQLSDFLDQYKGTDKELIAKIVQNEIKGCDLGLNMVDAQSDVRIEHPGPTVNTPETEFAPIAIKDDLLYFSSTMAARAEIYRSQKENGKWTSAAIPEGFPKIEKDHFCNGTFSPDMQRFYFTICKSVESWGGLTTRCEIQVIKRTEDSWSAPERLRDYINMPDFSTTHPSVAHVDKTEVLYFSSNRKGGFGGMDIWYATRSINSDDIDFTFPVNAGSKINTIGDEITPSYDQREGKLFFASNGQVSIGGYDIFGSTGSKSFWDKPENLGVPFNSSADDFFFVQLPSGNGGYFVSNRIFGMEKIATTDEDIFEFKYPKINTEGLMVRGQVIDENDGIPLSNISLTLYELPTGGNRTIIGNDVFRTGSYGFGIELGKKYVLEARKEGYLPKTITFHTIANGTTKVSSLSRDLVLSPLEQDNEDLVSEVTDFARRPTAPAPIVPEPTVTKQRLADVQQETSSAMEKVITTNSPAAVAVNEPQRTTQPTVEKVTAPTKVWEQPTEVVQTTASEGLESAPAATETYSQPTAAANTTSSSARTTTYAPPVEATKADGSYAPEVRSGTYYKVQLIAVRDFGIDESRYANVRGLGRMETELIPEKNLIRVMIGGADSYEDAISIRSQARNQGFSSAYLVKYRDGNRIGMIK